jgi:hypothetical protein
MIVSNRNVFMMVGLEGVAVVLVLAVAVAEMVH